MKQSTKNSALNASNFNQDLSLFGDENFAKSNLAEKTLNSQSKKPNLNLQENPQISKPYFTHEN